MITPSRRRAASCCPRGLVITPSAPGTGTGAAVMEATSGVSRASLLAPVTVIEGLGAGLAAALEETLGEG